MLYFTEADGPRPEMLELNDEFEKHYDTHEYESRISRLIRNAYKRDRKNSQDQLAKWWENIRILERGDHYILVMVDRAHLRPPRDFLKLMGAAIGFTAVSLLDFWYVPDPFLKRVIYFGFLVLCWVLVSPLRRRVLWKALRALADRSH
jgi:hypothetical protein